MRHRYISREEQIFKRERPSDHPDECVFDQEFIIDHRYVQARERLILLPGFTIIYRNWLLQDGITMETKHENAFFKMQFELEGFSDFKSGLSCCPTDVLIPGGKHTLMFLPEVHGDLHYPRSRKVVDIVLNLEYIKKLFQEDLSIFDKFGRCIENSESAMLGSVSGAITPAMRHIINDILHCTFDGMMKKIYLESKVVELLIMQIDYFNSRTLSDTDLRLRPEDVEKLHYIRDLITENPEDQYSLTSLSGLAGLNDFKLKKGFKTLFGNTVFGYISDVRMEKAKVMILEGENSIIDISLMTGYKYPQHFTKAFKKKFGYLPSELKLR